MQDGIQTSVKSITTGNEQTLYLSKHDADLIKGKKVAIVDDVVSTGGSLKGLEQIVNLAGGIIYKKAFVLAEGDAAERDDIVYLAKIPIITVYSKSTHNSPNRHFIMPICVDKGFYLYIIAKHRT